jgi:hypothetical protein
MTIASCDQLRHILIVDAQIDEWQKAAENKVLDNSLRAYDASNQPTSILHERLGERPAAKAQLIRSGEPSYHVKARL